MTVDLEFDVDGWASAEAPLEPDWNEFKRMLQQAEDWLRSEEADEFPGDMEACEAVGLLRDMLHEYESDDDRVRAFVSKIEWAAFWIQGKVDDPELQERVQRLCETSGEILASMAKASEDARAVN